MKFERRSSFVLSFVRWSGCVLVSLILLGNTRTLHAGPIAVPNASFESPTTFFVTLNLDSWQRTPEPEGWDPNTGGEWDTLAGIFKNTAPGSADHIDNCDGEQAMWLFAVPGAGVFQDYNSVDWDDTEPSHAFDATFQPGDAYRLQAGILVGMGVGGAMQQGVTLDLSLYYRDALNNRMIVATTVVTNTTSVFSNANHLIDYEVNVPTVQPTDPWANQNIGILFLSSVSSNMQGGYWDLDNVRLTAIGPPNQPVLSSPTWNGNQFECLLESEPGLAFEMLAATNITEPASNWLSLATLTNATGTIPFVDTNTNFNQRFYQARQLP
jgi:hypothetical protein